MADSSHSCSAHGAGTRSIVLGERLSIHTSPQCSSDYTDGKCELKQRPGLIPRSQGVFFSQSWRSCDERSGCSPSTRVSSFSFSSLSATGSSQTTRQDCKQLYQRDHVNHCGLEIFYQADAFQWPIDPTWVPTIADTLVGFLLDGLIR